jgi:DNA-directed RNA polymerase specialized sigma24 family protein
MEIAEEDIHYFLINGVRYTTLSNEAIYKYFYGGVPVEEIARIRGCSIGRIQEIAKRQKDTYRIIDFERQLRQQLQQREEFDKALAKLDPTGTSAITMAYLQPMRNFLENL